MKPGDGMGAMSRQQAEALYTRLAREASIRRRRRAALRAWRASAILAAYGVIAITLLRPLLSLAPSTAPQGTSLHHPNYLISDISVARGSGSSTAIITYRVSWSSGRFPGVHLCTWDVYGSGDALIGRRTDEMISLERSRTAELRIPVSGIPVDAEASCDPRRLDTGEPYRYAFRGIEAERIGAPETKRVRVTFRAEWVPRSHPGVVTCVVKLHDAGGHPVLVGESVFSSGRQRVANGTFTFPAHGLEGSPVRGLRASIECRPFGS
jgi:hypothetical protein